MNSDTVTFEGSGRRLKIAWFLTAIFYLLLYLGVYFIFEPSKPLLQIAFFSAMYLMSVGFAYYRLKTPILRVKPGEFVEGPSNNLVPKENIKIPYSELDLDSGLSPGLFSFTIRSTNDFRWISLSRVAFTKQQIGEIEALIK